MKKKNINIDILKRIKSLNRQEEINKYGKLISFRTIISKNKKIYSRKNKHKNNE